MAETFVVVGVSPDLMPALLERCGGMGKEMDPPQDPMDVLLDVLSRRPGSPSVQLRYRRPNGDVGSFVSSTQHLIYAAKGLVAVELGDEQHLLDVANARA
jgi:hypothetical protein